MFYFFLLLWKVCYLFGTIFLGGMFMLIIGSHVSFKKDTQLLGSAMEGFSYGGNTFMYYTGAPQNTNRALIDSDLTKRAHLFMKDNGIDINNVIVHAPYIINLANGSSDKYKFSIRFLKEECKRCEMLGTLKLVLHPGSHVGLGEDEGINNIAGALNEVLGDTKTTILLETMAGKGTEVGKSFEQLKRIFDLVKYPNLGICLDTCHLFDGGYDISLFDDVLDELDRLGLFDKIGCIHVNDSKNVRGSHKDRHENIGFGEIGFDTLISIIYNERVSNIPKILETPYVDGVAPYKYEIPMIKEKVFDEKLKDKIKKTA